MVLATAFAIILPRDAPANGPEVGFDAGSIVPVASVDVELLREHVDLYTPFDDRLTPWHVECHYVLANRSAKPRRIRMSFLAGKRANPWGSIPRRLGDGDFRVQVRGVPVPVSLAPIRRDRWEAFGVDLPDSLPVWEVDIAAGDSTVVTMSYPVEPSGGSEGTSSSLGLQYVARPAALWAGRIRNAEIRVHVGETMAAFLRCLPPEGGTACSNLRFSPGDIHWTWDGFAWTRTDWEPDQDFRFDLSWERPDDEER